jgi:hypothetical protein
MQLRRAGERSGRRTDKERGAVVAAPAVAGRTQDRCRGECSGHGTGDTADHRGRLGIGCDSHDCAVTNRDGAGRMVTAGPVVSLAVALTTSWRRRWQERVPCPAAPIALRRTPTPPYAERALGLLCQSRATGSNLSRLQFISGGAGRIFPAWKTAPSFSTDSTGQKFVIAVADGGFLKRLWFRRAAP